MRALGWILVVVTVGMWIMWGYNTWALGRDTNAFLKRAQVAANADDMLDYINQLRQNMERLGMAKGHAALIFKTPYNDMGLIYRSVVKIVERLETIKKLDPSSTTYQVALDDLRGTTRELRLHYAGWYMARHALSTYGSFVVAIVAIVLLMFAPVIPRYPIGHQKVVAIVAIVLLMFVYYI
jgi:hypothetical protein